ncbi:hypothetical protein KCU88_g9, partial [Aureobasidium melanogenum]
MLWFQAAGHKVFWTLAGENLVQTKSPMPACYGGVILAQPYSASSHTHKVGQTCPWRVYISRALQYRLPEQASRTSQVWAHKRTEYFCRAGASSTSSTSSSSLSSSSSISP